MTQGQAWLLAGGATNFLAGDLWFRATLGIPRGIWRTVAAPVLLATAAVGLTFSAIAQLAALAAVLIASLAAESNKGHRPEHGGKAA
jgi:hypothetical protein